MEGRDVTGTLGRSGRLGQRHMRRCLSGPAPDDRRDDGVVRGEAEMTSDDALRASDRDRELAAEVLRDAYAAGRIDLDEFHDRAGAAYSARTWGELRDLTADLPTGHVLSGAAFGAGSLPGLPGCTTRPGGRSRPSG